MLWKAGAERERRTAALPDGPRRDPPSPTCVTATQ